MGSARLVRGETEDALTVGGLRDLSSMEGYVGPVVVTTGDRGVDLEYVSMRLRGSLTLLVERGIGSHGQLLEIATARSSLYPASVCEIQGLGWYWNRDRVGNTIIRDEVYRVSSDSLLLQIPSIALQTPEALIFGQSLENLRTFELRFLDPEPVCDFLFFYAIASSPIEYLAIHIPVHNPDPTFSSEKFEDWEERESDFYMRLLAPPLSIIKAQVRRGSSSVHTLRFLPYDETPNVEEEATTYDEPQEALVTVILRVLVDILGSVECPRGITGSTLSVAGSQLSTIEGLPLSFESEDFLRSYFPNLTTSNISLPVLSAQPPTTFP